MEPAELREILSIDGLRLLDSLPAYESSADVVRIVSELRKQGHPAGLVAAVLNQLKLRSRAIAKFGPFAQQMLFTEDGLEQATRLRVAALHAGRYRAAGMASVADLGCGIGADAIAMAAIELQVTAVEIDEVTAAIATFNLAPWSKATVLNTRAEDVELSGVDAVFLDPARRSDGRRLNDPADWMPSLDFAFGLATKHPVGVKLGPGIDRDLIPAGTEAQWISIDRDVVELGVWFGPLARADVGRAALVIGDHGVAELTAVTDSPDVEVGPLGEYLYEPDGAVIRARLIGDLARTIDARMLSDQIAWITADRQVNTPFAQGFRVTMTMAFDEKKLKRELSARNIGILEIKKRGIDVDPAQLRTRLGLAGTDAATLILTRVAGRRTAILAHRL
jgi:SAM-dependent methyltransferase